MNRYLILEILKYIAGLASNQKVHSKLIGKSEKKKKPATIARQKTNRQLECQQIRKSVASKTENNKVHSQNISQTMPL